MLDVFFPGGHLLEVDHNYSGYISSFQDGWLVCYFFVGKTMILIGNQILILRLRMLTPWSDSF